MAEKRLRSLIQRQPTATTANLAQRRVQLELAAIAYAPASIPVPEKRSGKTIRAIIGKADRVRALATLNKLRGESSSVMQSPPGPRLQYREDMPIEEVRRSLLNYLQWRPPKRK